MKATLEQTVLGRAHPEGFQNLKELTHLLYSGFVTVHVQYCIQFQALQYKAGIGTWGRVKGRWDYEEAVAYDMWTEAERAGLVELK